MHLTWENEALREVAADKDELEIVYPPVSIRAEPAVAWVDANLKDPKGGDLCESLSRISLQRRRTGDDRQIRLSAGRSKNRGEICEPLGAIKLFQITAIAKDWDDAREKFFADNGIIDVIAPAKDELKMLNCKPPLRR